ncbi:hypothetical protein [Yersinia bercovieri]|uniref:hypothetical protein n=1 Tax=Yersinia bercovieri TaxID=634 RepID=UPI00119D39DC|nr:hypothetical protein [Yersinia bercovieri]
MLVFSISRRVTGLSRTPQQQNTLDETARMAGHNCEFCGYASPKNTVIFRDQNLLNTLPDNLCVADPLCQAWQQLDTVTAEAGVIVYLPILRPEDINHLQRAIAQALESDSEEYRQDAKALLNWLTSHDKPVRKSWGTTHPQAFGEALKRLPEEKRESLLSRCRHLALALHPGRLKGRLATTGLDANTTWWSLLYRDYCSRS